MLLHSVVVTELSTAHAKVASCSNLPAANWVSKELPRQDRRKKYKEENTLKIQSVLNVSYGCNTVLCFTFSHEM
jgi:hypothetical protein